jgi:NADH-quinone oxidoreductase subunit M
MSLLSLAIWTPVFFGVVLLSLGRDQHANAVRWIALVGAVLSFLITVPLITGFDTTTSAMQFVENVP